KIFSVIKEEKDNEIAKERLQQVAMAYLTELSDEEKSRIGVSEEFLKGQLQNLLSPWSRFFLTYDPKPTLTKVKCPVLAKHIRKLQKENIRWRFLYADTYLVLYAKYVLFWLHKSKSINREEFDNIWLHKISDTEEREAILDALLD
ncbi:unnamed protein product, partial [marine sediment metagenome]